MISKLKLWLTKNWISIVLSTLLIGIISFHFFGTYNPPIKQAVIVSPLTKNKTLDNGNLAQIKVATPGTSDAQQAGFSERFVRDTIGKLIGVKNKENILAINQIKARYTDSLNLIKTELDEQKRTTRYYQAKDKAGNIISTAKSTEDGSLVYNANINLINTKKEGKKDRKGNKITPDSLIFYDPTQRATIYESKEYTYTLPLDTKKKKLRLTPTVGVGVVAPIEVKDSKINIKEVKPGLFVGFGASYTF